MIDSVVGLVEERADSVVHDFLNQFSNAGTLSMLHNRMWQSRNSEVNAHLVQYLFAHDLIRHGLQRIAPFDHELFRLQR